MILNRSTLGLAAAGAFLALALAPATALPDPLGGGACAIPDLVPDVQKVSAEPGGFVAVRFSVLEEAEAVYWVAMGARTSTGADTPLGGASAERVVASALYEDAEGELLARPNAFLYPYGVTATAADVGVRADAADGGPCMGYAAGSLLRLAPGEYRVVVLGASELGSEIAALLPPEVVVTSVARGPATVVSEATMDCATSVRVAAQGAGSHVLEGCSTAYRADSRAYRVLHVGHPRDADHQIWWDGPDGRVDPRKSFDIGSGSAGDWVLEVPRYVTPLAASFYPLGLATPAPSDPGVFGAFADV